MKHLSNKGYVLVAALVFAFSIKASAEVLILKDTRKFDIFISSISGLEGCVMPKDDGENNSENESDCKTKKGQYVASGELLMRDTVRGFCTHAVYSSERPKGVDWMAPSVDVKTEGYKCDVNGLKNKE